MDNELKSFLFERGADIVRFVDISELPTKYTHKDLPKLWKGNPFLDKITPNKNIPSKYCLSC